MDLKLQGKRALVTGASKGIGRAVAEALAAEGCNLALAARSEKSLEELAESLSKKCQVAVTTHVVDLSQSSEQQRLVNECSGIDILVNNAGAIPAGEIDEFEEEAWREAWDLKVFGYINLCRSFFREMKERGDGVIVNVIGTSGQRMNPMYIGGSAGNASLMALSRALGSRSTDFGVRVLAVNPGLTATDRARFMLQTWSEQKFGTPESLGRILGRDESAVRPHGWSRARSPIWSPSRHLRAASYISGTVLTVDGGASDRNH